MLSEFERDGGETDQVGVAHYKSLLSLALFLSTF
jgi:hypothetical protein